MNIAIIDYKVSNMFSIKNALDYLGYKCQITSNPMEILQADGAVLPGVGSFPEAMEHLYDLRLIEIIKEFISTGKPFMGICLGLQLLFSKSEEFYNCEGLNIIGGKVENFKKYIPSEPIPHVGWNRIENYVDKNDNPLQRFKKLNIKNNEYFYFVHSLFVKPDNKNYIFSETTFSSFKFCSSIMHDNIFACQFHPEKSGIKGLKIFEDFFSMEE